MKVTIELSQAQYHALCVRYLNADTWIQTQVRQIGDDAIAVLWADEVAKAQMDPDYQVSPDREAVVLGLEIPSGEMRVVIPDDPHPDLVDDDQSLTGDPDDV